MVGMNTLAMVADPLGNRLPVSCHQPRFYLPLIEPDVRISRIRLSDGIRGRSPRSTVTPCSFAEPLVRSAAPALHGGYRQHGHSPNHYYFPEHSRSQAPSFPRSYPASTVLWACPTPCPARNFPHGFAVGDRPPLDRVSRVALVSSCGVPSSLPRQDHRRGSWIIPPECDGCGLPL